MDEVARYYGFEPNRSGFMRCPFHQDRTASLKIYPGSGGFYCFGCGAGSSIIDFVERLFDLSFSQALLRINSDFRLGLTNSGPPSRAERSAVLETRRLEAEQQELRWREYREKAAEHRYWWEALKYFAPGPGARVLHPLYAEALLRLPVLEYWLDENMGR